ncbi:putative Ig domain-containing protein [Nonomuraea endophytica]|uniref:putative Ig domain-containing protein n=1 Tax=Nonomuraea endophytica TaxID=714136 RepID=UPI0037CABE34
MSRAISRESFDELKNYLGVYLQQGRPILDADWNENQDITVAALRRLGRETHGEGTPDSGFAIVPVVLPSDVEELTDFSPSMILDSFFGPWRFALNFPGDLLDDLEQPGFQLSSPQGTLRIAEDHPYQGQGFLRLSGHPGTVTMKKTLNATVDLSASDLATFRYRRNRKTAGAVKFFLEDDLGGKSVWPIASTQDFPPGIWVPALASPLDIRFRILTTSLRNAVRNDFYFQSLTMYGGTPPFTWAVVAGALPPGLNLPSGPRQSRDAPVQGSPTQAGTFTFTARVTDAANRTATRQLTLEVQAAGPERGRTTPDEASMLSRSPSETPTGTPANLTRIRAYGFEAPQDSGAPLVWDFDDLRVGSSARHRALASGDFVLRGAPRAMLAADAALLTKFERDLTGGNPAQSTAAYLVDVLSTADPDVPDAAASARMHVSGLTCLREADTLYSQQADPNDPPLTTPTGSTRRDTVYLDAWTEPLTYIDDPEIREVALGGPDTATRTRVRHRVRVAEGGGLPSGDGRGAGTLATEGSYTAQANRLYLVEVDTGGDLGAATFRWSEDNAATIQRVIEPVPPGSTRVSVEDATAFRAGDQILIRKEFGAEEHQVASVVGNVIGLVQPTGDQLADLPAAGRVPGFTTFALADRPMIQRWNAFRVPIPAGQDDPAAAAAIPLNDGVAVRFSGSGLRTGDFWNFRARFLPGDDAAGLDPLTRIERLRFQRPRGVVHHYAPLATLIRDPAAPEPDRISDIADLRRRAGNTNTVNLNLNSVTMTGTSEILLGGTRLPAVSPDSKLVTFWSAELFLPAQVNGQLSIEVRYYNDDLTDPIGEPSTGLLLSQQRGINLSRRTIGADLPFHFVFAGLNTAFQPLGGPFVPTSVQVVAALSGTNGSVSIGESRATVLELKKSTELINEIQD